MVETPRREFHLTLLCRLWLVSMAAHCLAGWTHSLVPSFLALGGEKGRGYLRQQLFPLRARFPARGKPRHVRPVFRRALPINIAKVANGIRRLAACIVQFVPARGARRET